MTNLLGHSLGRYHILEQLGEGGMATVYKAYDTRLETDVALKVIRTETLPQNAVERALKRFEREAKSLARLTHPFIVGIKDYGEYEGKPYLVMVYLPGGTLKQKLGKPMPWQEAVRILLPIADALDFAHSRNMIHRDVKPSNILLTERGQPMLTDFGIAKILDLEETADLTGTGMGIGTPEYMAPEQWTGKTSAQSDQYALGVVLYEMLTGRKPYTADTPAAILLMQSNEPLPRPSQYARDLPDKVEKLLLKALAKNPADRYPSTGDFAAALESILHGDFAPARERPVRPREPVTGTLGTVEREVEEPTQNAPLEQGRPKPVMLGACRSMLQRYWGVGVGLVVVGLCIALIVSLGSGGGMTLFPTKTPGATHTPTLTLTPTATLTPIYTPTPVLGVGSTWTSPQDGMTMLYIPAGEFEMGSEDGYSDEQPVHTVYLDAYWMDETEVTNAMYSAFLNERGNQNEGGATWLDASDDDVRIHLSGSTWKVDSGYGDHPVIEVSWYGAVAYCEWREARLPTEAEWEKAARGGLSGKKYPWGDDSPSCTKGARNGAQYGYCSGETVPVRSFSANGYGLFDLAGNLWEWVSSLYQSYPYVVTDGREDLSTLGSRVLRGGSWGFNNDNLRSSDRVGSTPDYTLNNLGFRCSRGTSP